MPVAMPDVATDVVMDVDTTTLDETAKSWVVVVLNDDINTFQAVIFHLVRLCKCTTEQAEKHAYTIHNNGSDAVYRDDDRAVCNNIAAELAKVSIKAEVREG